MKRVDEDEAVLTVVHLSEVANALEGCLGPEDLNEYFNSILYKDHGLYRLANEGFLIYGIGLNDAWLSYS